MYRQIKTDWLDSDHEAILDACTSICLAGNNTETPGTWLPSDRYFEGAFVNTPGGSSSHPLWMCACYDTALSQSTLVSGGGVVSDLSTVVVCRHILLTNGFQWGNA